MVFQQRFRVVRRQLVAGDLQPARNPWTPPRDDEVHLWRIGLEQPPAIAAELAATLSCDERERAARFVRDCDRARFVACRGAVRSVLGGYTGLPARSCSFGYGAHGKPRLVEPPAAAALQFNVSHSGDLALLAIAQDRAVGIDLEQIRPDVDVHGVGQLVFSAIERDVLRALPEEQQLAAFFDLWTCKEAYLKALGQGFFDAPQQVTLTATVESPESLRGSGEEAAPAQWLVASLGLLPGYAAAVAVEGDCGHFCYAEWAPADLGQQE